jgi:hypothetical protein
MMTTDEIRTDWLAGFAEAPTPAAAIRRMQTPTLQVMAQHIRVAIAAGGADPKDGRRLLRAMRAELSRRQGGDISPEAWP